MGSARHVDAWRAFNRFYTSRAGILREDYLESPFSLAEVRVLYEVAHQPGASATQLRRALDLDNGYLSRILKRLVSRGLVARAAHAADGRRSVLTLTKKGRVALAPLEARASAKAAALLAPLAGDERERLVDAMGTIQRVLGGPARDAPLLLRAPRAGELGWVVQRHGALYAEEYGWNDEFEGLVAGIVADFVKGRTPRERCWIAELDGRPVGCVFVVEKSRTVAQLRLLLVEPSARGHGAGSRLVGECIAFAREKGYRRMTLWTNDVLHAARHIYEKAGFRVVEKERHHSFGHDLVAETWELALS